ncbi:MAG: cysteine desulfurase-like protein [Gaiellaceae bacterium]
MVVVAHDHLPSVAEPGTRAPLRALDRSGRHPATITTLDIEAVRGRFSALRGELAFFDGPAGTQVPDEVVEAISRYLLTDNANVGGAFATSIRTGSLITQARIGAAAFLGCSPEEVGFGQSMTTLNFALTRAFGRELVAGDELVVTRLDHDANVAPWLHLARDRDLTVRFADIHDDGTLDWDDLERLLTERTRVVAFPVASNAVGTLVDPARIARLAHEAGALAWADAVHYAPHGPIDVAAWDVDVLVCSAYKFCGPHLGLFFGRRELLERWPAYKVRPSSEHPPAARYETGTLQHELLAGLVAAFDYLESLGWDAIQAHERGLGERFLAGLPASCRLYGLPQMDGRVPTFALTVDGLAPEQVAVRLAELGIAVWHGDYYAVEVMKRLGLPDGAVRVGILHYTAAEELDRLLAALASL